MILTKTHRSMELNREESPETNLQLFGQLMTKEAKKHSGKKDSLFNKWSGKTGHPHAKKVKLDHSLTLYTAMNSKWMKSL